MAKGGLATLSRSDVGDKAAGPVATCFADDLSQSQVTLTRPVALATQSPFKGWPFPLLAISSRGSSYFTPAEAVQQGARQR